MSNDAENLNVEEHPGPAGDLSDLEKSQGMRYGLYAAVLGVTFFFATNGNVLTLFARRLGASNTQIGAIVSLFLVFALVQVFVAGMIERRGKKPFLVGGWIASTILVIPFLFIPWVHSRWGSAAAIYTLMAVIVPLALARQVAIPGWMPLLNDVVPTHFRGRYFAKMRTAWQVAGIIFLVLTALFFGGSGSAPFWRYQVVFMVGIVASFLRVGALRKIPELPLAPPRRRPSIFKSFRLPFADSGFVRYVVFTALVTAAMAMTDSYTVIFLKSPQLDYSDSAALFTSTVVFFLGSAVSLLVWGWLADRLGAKPFLVITVIAMGLVRFLWLGALWKPGGGAVIVLTYLLYGVFAAGFGIANTKYLFGIAPRNFGKTTYMTIAGVIATLVSAVMVPAGGFIIDGLSHWHSELARFGLDEYRLPLVASGVMMVVTAVILVGLKEHRTVPTREVLSALFGRPLRTGYNIFLWGRALDESSRVNVTRTLGSVGGVIGEGELLKALDDPSFQVRREAVESLGRLKSRRTVKALVEKLRDPYSFVRISAAVALGEIGSPAACRALEQALDDPNEELRLQGALALGKIRREASIEPLRKAMSTETDPVVWSVMATARGMLSDETVAGDVVERLNPDTPAALRGQLLIALGNAIGQRNELYQYLHRGEADFEASMREILSTVRTVLRKAGGKADLHGLWEHLDVGGYLRKRDYKRIVTGAYGFALMLYGKELYPRGTAAGAALEALSTRRAEILWDSTLLALECLKVIIRRYPR